MNVYPDTLPKALTKSIAPVYMISGDEPLQIMEAVDQIRAACRKSGFTGTERYQVDNARSFDWQALAMSGNTMSLFGDKKIIGLHIPSGKPGTEGAKVLKKWCESPPQDSVLLITAGRPEGRFQTSAWFKAVDKAGVTMQVWPLSPAKTRSWIEQRLRSSEVQADAVAVDLLVERVEGNLLAAKQEIEKLAILYAQQKVGPQQVLASVTDSSRYTIIELIDAALGSETSRAIKVLNGLRAAGDSPVLICWHLGSEVRKINMVLNKIDQGDSPSQAMFKSGVWKNKQALVGNIIRQRKRIFWLRASADCSYLDLLSKGMAKGDLWIEIASFVTRLSGSRWPLLRVSDIN